MALRDRLKSLLIRFDIPLTQNLKYDIYTKKIMRRILHDGSNCMDIGCHKGEILDAILSISPSGAHFAFEPLPHLYEYLKSKYKGKNIHLYPVALFDRKETTNFKYVVNAPAYSGIRQRHYDFPHAEINEVVVETDLLDNIVSDNIHIDFIKIDVEGAEFPVLKGAIKMLCRCKPVVVFEFGLGAADYYDAKPEDLYDFFDLQCGMAVSTLSGFLHGLPALKKQVFCEFFNEGKEYYFVAHDKQAL